MDAHEFLISIYFEWGFKVEADAGLSCIIELSDWLRGEGKDLKWVAN